MVIQVIFIIFRILALISFYGVASLTRPPVTVPWWCILYFYFLVIFFLNIEIFDMSPIGVVLTALFFMILNYAILYVYDREYLILTYQYFF